MTFDVRVVPHRVGMKSRRLIVDSFIQFGVETISYRQGFTCQDVCELCVKVGEGLTWNCRNSSTPSSSGKPGLGFGVWRFRYGAFEVWGLGFGVWGLGFRV